MSEIMTTLFGQNDITSLYGEEKRKEKRKEGVIKGKQKEKLEMVRELLRLNDHREIIMQAARLFDSELCKLEKEIQND